MIGRLSLRGSASLVGSTHPISSSSRIGVGPPPSGTSSRSTLMCSPYTVSRTRLYPRMCCPVPPLRRETASDQYTNWAVVLFCSILGLGVRGALTRSDGRIWVVDWPTACLGTTQ